MQLNKISSIQNDVVSYVANLDSINPNLRWMLYRIYRKNAMYRYILTPITFFNKRLTNVRFIFYGSKYTELILSLHCLGENVAVIGGPKQLPFCLINGIPFLSNTHAWFPLADLLKGTLNENKISKLVNWFAKRLSGIEERYLVLDNDSVPMQRLISIAAEIAGVKTIYLQDGLFQMSSHDNTIIGRRSDYVFAYDEAQASVFISKGINSDKVRVMGHYLDRTSEVTPAVRTGIARKVCFLGQPWGGYRKEIGDIYLKETLKLIKIIQNEGIDVSFKPHPLERGSSYLSYIPNVDDISLSDALAKYDVFISYTSTALYEATIYNRISIQVWDPIFESDRFDELGYAHTVQLGNQNTFSVLIDLIQNAKPISLKQPHGSLSDRFLRCIATR